MLRSLVFAVDLGGFARAARRVGRSQSAISLQMRRLEADAGQALFARAGRSFALTLAGEQMLGYARRLLALNDEALAALRGAEFTRVVRLGLLPDFTETWLPAILAAFARNHPAVRLEAQVDRNLALLDALDRGRLDLALVFGVERPGGSRLAELAMAWIAARSFAWSPSASLPLVVLEAPCVFRAAALDALDRRGIRWHIAFASQSLGGVWAAVAAGLGATVRTAHGMPGGLRALGAEAGLPALPSVALWMHGSALPESPLVGELRSVLAHGVARQLAAAANPAAAFPARRTRATAGPRSRTARRSPVARGGRGERRARR